jgi:hypothetical protein
MVVDADRNPHSARTKLKGQAFAPLFQIPRIKQSERLFAKINLHHSSVKEVRAHEPVHRALTRTTQPIQIDRKEFARQGEFADLGC